jgi:hypothetical protein
LPRHGAQFPRLRAGKRDRGRESRIDRLARELLLGGETVPEASAIALSVSKPTLVLSAALREPAVLCIACLIAVVAWRGAIPSQQAHFGDDQEYLTMATSFMRHGSADVRPGDVERTLRALPYSWQRNLKQKQKFPAGRAPVAYYESRDHRFYGWHFFTYPASVAPMRALLRGGLLAARAHQYTNLLVFSAALLSLLQLRHEPRLFWTLTPMVFLTPALWFLTYASTETFVLSLGVIALSCHLGGRPRLAIFFNSVAATQYQPLAPLSLFLCAYWLWQRSRTERGPRALLDDAPATLSALACAAIVFIPGLFYFAHFGVPNLIAREGLASARLMSASKFAWMFVDPNGGMLFFTPGLLLLLFVALWAAAARARRERSGWGLGLGACALFTMFASTCQLNWNHPTFGVSRYVLYAIAPLLLFIGAELAHVRFGAARVAAVLTAIALQLAINLHHGFFTYRGPDANHHTEAARYVLDRWPALYSPPPDIFCERTRHKCQSDPRTGLPLASELPVVYRDERGEARKILTADCDAQRVLRRGRWSSAQAAAVRAAFERCHGPGLVYLEP